jgi:hypothetical protein
LDNLSFYVHSNHRCGMHIKMSFVVFESVVQRLWLPPCSIVSSFYMSPHCDSSSHNLCNVCLVLLYVFVGATCLVLCGTESALLASIVVMLSSHNIVAFLCYCSVDCFILEVTILRYDCKSTLNIVIIKLFVVNTYKPWTNF